MSTQNNKDWSAIRARLQARQQELKSEVEQVEQRIEASLAAWEGEVMDTKDAARRQDNLELRLTEIARDKAELAEIQIALDRMDDGAYGICIDCDEPIALQRLQVRPESARCLGCEEKFEAASR